MLFGGAQNGTVKQVVMLNDQEHNFGTLIFPMVGLDQAWVSTLHFQPFENAGYRPKNSRPMYSTNKQVAI